MKLRSIDNEEGTLIYLYLYQFNEKSKSEEKHWHILGNQHSLWVESLTKFITMSKLSPYLFIVSEPKAQ